MSTDDVIRVAVRADNPRLIELERSCPQGTRLVIASERRDFFFRSELYGGDHTLVAVDRSNDRLIGAVAGTVKELLLGGRPFSGAFLYDLRVHPDYRRSVLGRHMLRAWNALNDWAEENGSAFVYGLIKSDNETMMALQRKKGYRIVGKMVVLGRPVFRRSRVSVRPRELDLTKDGAWISEKVSARYGASHFFPTAFEGRYVTEPMQKTGLFSCYCAEDGESFASIGLFRVNRTMLTRVLRLPGAYRIARPILEAVARIIAVPRIPQEGGTVSYCHVFNHIAEGPRGVALWRELIRHANNLALDEGASLLMSAFDESDSFLPAFARGAINRIEYLLGCRAFNGDLPAILSPYYPDIRDMM